MASGAIGISDLPWTSVVEGEPRQSVARKPKSDVLLSEVRRLAELVRAGQLAERGSVEGLGKRDRDVLESINQILDAVANPVEESTRVLESISSGEIDERIEGHFPGDFARLKDALNSVQSRIAYLAEDLAKISNGELTSATSTAFGGDRIGETIEALRNNIQAVAIDAASMASAVAAGKVDYRADVERHQGEYRSIIEGMNQTLDATGAPLKVAVDTASALASACEEFTAVSESMAVSADGTSAQIGIVSAASDQVSQNVSSVAAAADQMKSSIREIAKNAHDSAQVARNAVGVAQSTNETVKKLGASSQEVGNVVRVIHSIAQQTNLLALNAAIEAARAGAAGKGFAVVATEVKELAKQTAKATDEINQKIEAIQGDTRRAMTAIEEIGGIIDQINQISNSIAAAVEEQTSTTNEISRSATDAARGVTDIAKSIEGVAAAASSTTDGANNVKAASLELSHMAAWLQESVSRFAL